MNVTIQIDEGGAGRTLSALVENLANRRPLHAALGGRGETELEAHFAKRAQEPNKQGWTAPGGRFWDRIRGATALAAVDESGATIAISDPAFAGKLTSGTTVPREKKYLAIPAIAEAYGRSPLLTADLEPIVRWIDGSQRAIALGKIQGKGAERKETIWYWLVKSVRRTKDPQALPEDAKFLAALHEETDAFFEDLRRG